MLPESAGELGELFKQVPIVLHELEEDVHWNGRWVLHCRPYLPFQVLSQLNILVMLHQPLLDH